MSTLSTIPASFEMAATETLAPAIDFSVWLSQFTPARTIASVASVTLVDLATTLNYAAGIGARTNTTTTVTQTLTAIQAGHRYRLAITITDSAGQLWTSELAIVGVF